MSSSKKGSKALAPTIRRSGELPVGKPAEGEERSPLRMLSFKADDETIEALDRLVNALDASIRTRRSTAIRSAILAADKALRTPKESGI